MNYLVYLAGPLDGLDIDGTTWYDEFNKLKPDKLVGFMPGRAYLGAAGHAKSMDDANRAVIRVSLCVLANLSGPGRALGTIREIEFAVQHGKPVFVVGDLSASLAAHDLTLCPDLEDAIYSIVKYYL